MSAYYEFKLPAKILSGDGALEHIPHELDSLGAHRPLLLSDQGLEQVGTVKIVQAALRQGGMAAAETFCRIPPDSSIQVVNQIAGLYRQAQCDSLIAVGGGSVIDTAKGVGMVLAQAGSDLLDSAGCEVLPRGAHVPFVAVPTTAGTGSEVTSFAVLTDRAKGVKYPLVDDALLPDEAILDPSLLAGVPPAVTADTGMDVLTHAAEAYVARGATPYTDALAEKAFTLAWQNLRPAWETAGESGAKGNMLLASNLAGIAFNAAGLGICHSLAHALGGRFHLPHGRLNALILPHVIHFNAADGTAAEKYGRLAKLCGLAANPRSLAAGLNRLRAQLKLPERLSACGVEGKELTAALDGLAEAAQADLCAPSNPRPAAAEDLKSLLRELA